MNNIDIARILHERGWIADSPIGRDYAKMLSYGNNGRSFLLGIVIINADNADFQADFYEGAYFTHGSGLVRGGEVRGLNGLSHAVTFVDRTPYLFGTTDVHERDLITDFTDSGLVYVTRPEKFEDIGKLEPLALM